MNKVIKVYNNLPNRTTDMKPNGAVKGGDDVIMKVKESANETQEDEVRTPPEVYNLGDAARVKSSKGGLYKNSD